jgi:hypothetical protein
MASQHAGCSRWLRRLRHPQLGRDRHQRLVMIETLDKREVATVAFERLAQTKKRRDYSECGANGSG